MNSSPHLLWTAAISGAGVLGSLTCGLVYANFSARVMPRLAALRPAEAVATMQHFNVVALRAPFMTAFFGSAALGLVALGLLATHRHPASWLAAVGGGLYLAGFSLTIARNVPLNEALAALPSDSAQAADLWQRYLAQWTPANTVRAALSLAAAAAFAAAVAAARG
ncbi:MAG: anthrone oxygenase family protein [Micropruina glycogenica]|jgi:uncharacterized membrane protein